MGFRHSDGVVTFGPFYQKKQFQEVPKIVNSNSDVIPPDDIGFGSNPIFCYDTHLNYD